MQKTKSFLVAVMAMTSLTLPLMGAGQAEAKLAAKAKITKAEAEHIALAEVHHGSVKSAEIEHEKGHLVWSFDIATPGTKDITEILVDAHSGRIISKQSETPRDQAAEAAADKKK
jgi:uncharacterized membrane protein YkoI